MIGRWHRLRSAAGAASPIQRVSSSSAGNTDVAGVTIAYTGAAGDVAIFLGGYCVNNNFISTEIRTSGWTEIATPFDGPSASNSVDPSGALNEGFFILAWKEMSSASETVRIDQGASNSETDTFAGAVIVFRGVDTASPVDAGFACTADTLTATIASPTVTPSVSGGLVVSGAMSYGGDTGGGPISSDVLFYKRIGIDVPADGGRNFGLALGYRRAPAASISGGDWSVGGADNMVAFTLSLRPAT